MSQDQLNVFRGEARLLRSEFLEIYRRWTEDMIELSDLHRLSTLVSEIEENRKQLEATLRDNQQMVGVNGAVRSTINLETSK